MCAHPSIRMNKQWKVHTLIIIIIIIVVVYIDDIMKYNWKVKPDQGETTK